MTSHKLTPPPKAEEDSRARLQRAAMELFREQGYDRTTTAEIAARAGLAERTLFRHFPDKREVLFDGASALRAVLASAIAGAPPELGPLDTLFLAFRATLPMLEANRSYSKPRQDIVSATPALFERELAKHDALAQALAAGLRERGVPDLRAELAAKTAMIAYVQAVVGWVDTPAPGLGERLDLSLRELRAITGPAGAV